MKILVLDTDGVALDFCYRCACAGHQVKWWIPKKNGYKPRIGEGFDGIERVDTWQPHMAWAKSGLVVNMFNERKVTAELDRWRSFGFTIFGPTVKSAMLEWERSAGMKFMQDHGIEIPTFHTFKSLDECIKFAWKADQAYVFKTCGDQVDKSLTYVSSDPADLVSYLTQKKDDGLKLKGEMYLQEKIEMVAEVGISAWMGKDGFLPNKFNVNFEFKKFMAGDFGPSTGEEMTVTQYLEDCGKMSELLMTFEESLVKLGHIGDFDIGCGIDKKGNIHPYEFSCRFGFPSTPILMFCHEGDPVEWMYDAAKSGKDSLEVDYRVAMGVIMTRPPYPHGEDFKCFEGFRIDGIEDVWDHVSPIGMMIENGPIWKDGKVSEGPIYKTASDIVCVVNALGPDVHDVIPEVYAAIDKIKFADRQVRNDGGKKLEQELPKLHALGFKELPQW